MASKPPRAPGPPSAGATGWEQSEEVARRLLDDMAAAEARERAARLRDREYGHQVAEAHKHGEKVDRPWEQEEEVYRRLVEVRRPLAAQRVARLQAGDANAG